MDDARRRSERRRIWLVIDILHDFLDLVSPVSSFFLSNSGLEIPFNMLDRSIHDCDPIRIFGICIGMDVVKLTLILLNAFPLATFIIGSYKNTFCCPRNFMDDIFIRLFDRFRFLIFYSFSCSESRVDVCPDENVLFVFLFFDERDISIKSI